MKILITGGLGFIAKHLRAELQGRKIKHCLGCDITNVDDLKKIFETEKIDTIIHLAAKTGVRDSISDPYSYELVNIAGTINLLELARKFKVKNFVFASSSSVYGNNSKIINSEQDKCNQPLSPYAATKIAGELFCWVWHHLFNLNVTCLRFFTVYGPEGRPEMAIQKFVKNILQNKEIEVYGDGNSFRDYTYVSDIVDGIILAALKQSKYEIINLGGGCPIKLKDLIKMIEKISGKKAKMKRRPMHKADVLGTTADISKAKKILNWQPKVPIEKGLEQVIKWQKKELKINEGIH
jgi:UDP-glucuronate 4-epimerase